MKGFLLGGLGFAFVLLLAACVPSSPPPTSTPSLLPTPTEAPFYAPDFTMTALDGGSVSLSAQRGQWVILNFWATWCAPCVDEMPALQALAASRADSLHLFGINVRESVDLVRAFVAEHAITFPILVSPPDSVLTDYLVMGLPQTVVIAPDGELVWRQFGPLDLADFNTLLDSLMQTSG